MKRVAIDGRCLQGDFGRRGVGTFARNVVSRLRALEPRLEYALLVAAGQEVQWAFTSPADLETVRLRPFTLDRPLSIPLVPGDLAFLGAARRIGADLLYFPAQQLAPAFMPIPAVLTVHDTIPEHYPRTGPQGACDRLHGRLLARNARRALAVVTGSNASATDIARLYGVPVQRISVIPYGLDETMAPPSPEAIEAARKRLALPDRYLLYYGGFDARKNVPGLFDAYERISPAAEVHLVVAGALDSWTRRWLAARRAASPHAARIHLHGYVAPGDLCPLIGAARALAFSSRYEGFGLTVLEAMACGAPVVAFANSSIPEVAGDAALLVDDGDLEAFSNALLAVCADDRLHARLRAAGIERARSFRWADCARKVAAVLTRAAGLEPLNGSRP